MSNAFLVIDVQSYFLESAHKDLPLRIAKSYDAVSYDHIAFTIFKNEPDSNFVKSLKWDKCSQDEDLKLPEDFSSLATDENTFTRASYSAFKTTGLHDYLKQRNVDRLIICGVDSDACVLATAFEAFDLGYHVKIDFNLTFSSNGYDEAAHQIAECNIFSRD